MLVTVLLGIAATLATYVAQRLFYSWRSKRCSHVERTRMSWRSDAMVCSLALLFALAGVSGIFTGRELENFNRAQPGDELLEFEVVELDRRGLTLLVYPALARDYRMPQAERGVLVTPGTSFQVVVERITFNPLLRAIGQPSLGRVVSVSGYHTENTRSISLGTPRTLEFGDDPAAPLNWLFYTMDESATLQAPPDIHRGDIFVVRRNSSGYMELVAAPKRGE